MSFTKLKKSKRGFTVVEVMIALALISIFVFMALDYSSALSKRTSLNRSSSTKNRILAGIRDLAAMPASLRVSMRASSSTGAALNPELLACTGGNPINSCTGGVEVPFTLFSPIIQRTSTGAVLGVQPISSPLGSTTPMRIDTFGAPCTDPGPGCPLLVFTTFKAQCGPAPLPSLPAGALSLELLPTQTCTIADVIEVTYYVQLDTTVVGTDSSLQSFVTPVSGSVVVSVVAISGNVPQ